MADKKKEKRRTWERLSEETDIQWGYFQCYRNMGVVRRQTKVAVVMGKSTALMQKCAEKHDWRERCFEYDLHMDSVAVAAKETDLQKMHCRHLQLTSKIHQLAEIELTKLVDGANYDGLPTIKVSELAGLLKHGTELERLTRDQPTEITQTADDYSNLGVDDLKELKRLAALIKKAGGK